MMLQDLLDLEFFMFIDCHWWGVGSHSIVLVGLQQADVKNVMNALQRLSMLPAREVQMVGSFSYTFGYLEWSKLPGALQSQVPSA